MRKEEEAQSQTVSNTKPSEWEPLSPILFTSRHNDSLEGSDDVDMVLSPTHNLSGNSRSCMEHTEGRGMRERSNTVRVEMGAKRDAYIED